MFSQRLNYVDKLDGRREASGVAFLFDLLANEECN